MGPALKSSAFVMRYEVFFFLEKIVASDWRRNEIVQIVLELTERTHEFLPWKGYAGGYGPMADGLGSGRRQLSVLFLRPQLIGCIRRYRPLAYRVIAVHCVCAVGSLVSIEIFRVRLVNASTPFPFAVYVFTTYRTIKEK